MRLDDSLKDSICCVCRESKKRCDVTILLKEDCDRSYDILKSKDNYIHYICKRCNNSLKKSRSNSENQICGDVDNDRNVMYICTCCHKESDNRKSFVLFNKKKYDFSVPAVLMCLNDDVRRKNSIFEYICNGCHSCLRTKEFTLPSIPVNAFAKKCSKGEFCIPPSSIKSKSDVAGQQHSSGSSSVNFNDILRRMKQAKCFEDLSNYIQTLRLPALGSLNGTQHLPRYCKDLLAFSLLPNDCGLDKEHLLPVYTRGDGNCFMYALSRLVYGDESHAAEMRVRVVCEGIKNRHLYLDHDYLCRGYDFTYRRENHLGNIYTAYTGRHEDDDDFEGDGLVELYERELFQIRENFKFCGVWQFHQAANVLDCPIQGFYPDVAVANLKKDLHRVFLPADLTSCGKDPVCIMWTQFSWLSVDFNHFVPVVQKNPALKVVDVNRKPAGVAVPERRRTVDNVDLTGEGITSERVESPTTSANIKFVDLTDGKQVHGKHDDYSDIIGKVPRFKCTCCHQSYTRDNTSRFDYYMYDMRNSSIVRNALSGSIRCKDSSGEEFICRTCDFYLASRPPKMPRNAIFKRNIESERKENEEILKREMREAKKRENEEKKRQDLEQRKLERETKKKQMKEERMATKEKQKATGKKREVLEKAKENFRKSCKELPEYVCTCCHRMLFLKGVSIFNRDRYGYSNRAVIKALDTGYRYVAENKDHEYICQTCHRNLLDEKLPVQAVANGLEVPDVPDELTGLTLLEVRCIALRIPFMCLRSLRKGGQGKIRGPCVNVPATMEPICEVLPRVPEDLNVVLLEFKRHLKYRNSYISDYIRPNVVMTALKWLKLNNPHYVNITVDENWIEKFEASSLRNRLCEPSQQDETDEIDECEVSVIQTEEQDEHIETCSKNEVGNNKSCEVHGSQSSSYSICSSGEEDSSDYAASEENSESDGETSEVSEDSDTGNSDLEDRTFQEEQKEINRKAEITVEPTATCMQIEDLGEAVFSIAPGQDSLPKYILMDEDFEVLAFPNLFPGGFGGFDVTVPREENPGLRRYINQRLLNKDPRFSQNIEYIFAFQYATEAKQLRTDMQMALKRTNTEDGRITAGQLKNSNSFNQMIWKDITYKFMRNVVGTR